MSRGSPLTTALFWLMFLVGGGSLAIGLYLPPWLENRALQDQIEAGRQHVAELDTRLIELEVRIEHIKTDPAYQKRLLREEFGISTPGREVVRIEPIPANADSTPGESAAPDDRRAQIESAIETAARTHPVVSLFVQSRTRPIVMGLSLTLLLAALALLGRSAQPPIAETPSEVT